MDEDSQFFAQHPDRQSHIRVPHGPKLHHDQKTRSVRYLSECELEFRSLGPHQVSRRRLLLYRVPQDNPHYDAMKQPLLKIPFLLFADETVEDRDDVLLPIIHEIMTNARGQ